MAKATLEFNLPEEKDAYYDATNGTSYCILLTNLNNRLRNELKHNDKLSPKEQKIIEKIKRELIEDMADNQVYINGINL